MLARRTSTPPPNRSPSNLSNRSHRSRSNTPPPTPPTSNPLAEPAYAVPLRVDRTAAPVYRIVNVGHERLVGLTFCLLGSGVMNTGTPRPLDVGGVLEVIIRGEDLARRSVLVVRWFRPTGEEYLWRVSF
ncbi:hypothetical protein [Subtercola boreus]|uniref:hypothetical protein n=1 Tax=Subtercola boreus TaxID=120213 RepID=UPI001C0ED679|nr:hypothetical protein [Subtercola boreus]